MAKFLAVVDGEDHVTVDLATGDYRIAAATAVGMTERKPSCRVKIWCEDVLDQYGPYWYRVVNDVYGNLVVKSD